MRQLHDPPGRTKRYHFDDLLIYVPRSDHYPKAGSSGGPGGAVVYERGAMGHVNEIWQVGQWSFDLCDLG